MTEEACQEAVAVFNSIGKGSDVHYAPDSLVLRAECKATNPAVRKQYGRQAECGAWHVSEAEEAAQLGVIEDQEIKRASLENEWYYLNRSRQVGPFSQSELHLLLAKEVMSSSTLVRTHDGSGWRPLRELSNEPARPDSSRSNCKFVALFIIPFVVGIVAPAPK